jgi:hypothetical protein
MSPLENLRNSVQVIGGLDLREADPGNDGGGDHARATATFLTGARARKTDGKDIHVGVSIDQVIAKHVGSMTRFPSLELSCDRVRKSGQCETGYSCAYQFNISWQSPSTPMTPEVNPRLVFERLFGSPTERGGRSDFERRLQLKKSLLDFVIGDAKALQRQLSSADSEKVEEYLTSVREIEQRIQHQESFGILPHVSSTRMPGDPHDYSNQIELMYDMLALALQTDSTRVATLLLAGDGTNRSFPSIGVNEGHHSCSHHRGNPYLLKQIALIDEFYMQHFARFLKKLDAIFDPDGKSVLFNSMIVYGCGNSDGNRHTHTNLPVILAGGGGGLLSPGRTVRYDSTPLTNLYMTLSERMGVLGVPRIGDSTGRLPLF